MRWPSVRRLVHDVAQNFLHPRGRLLLEAVDVDGPGNNVEVAILNLNRMLHKVDIEFTFLIEHR